MKIIDLLVKTSESEEPPKKIKYKNHIFIYFFLNIKIIFGTMIK